MPRAVSTEPAPEFCRQTGPVLCPRPLTVGFACGETDEVPGPWTGLPIAHNSQRRPRRPGQARGVQAWPRTVIANDPGRHRRMDVRAMAGRVLSARPAA